MSPAPGTQLRQATVGAGGTVVTTTETAVATLQGVSTDGADKRVDIRGELSITGGTGTLGYTVRIRRGTDATGAQVGPSTLAAGGAGSASQVGIEVQDTPGDVAGQAYTMTVQQSAATGNATIQGASIEAEIVT